VRQRNRAALRLLGFVIAVSPTSAATDHCAPPPPVRTAALGLELALRAEHAEYSTETYAGNYSGAAFGAAFIRPRWDMALDVPFYHLLKNGLDVAGPGDPYLRGRVQLFGAKDRVLALGAAVGLSAPLGRAEDDLGMGHFMVHPAVWLRAGTPELRSEWTLGYGRILGSLEGGHGTGPLVNPMNASELSLGGAVVWRLRRGFDVRVAGMAAVPAFADGGEARATVGLGGGLLLGKVATKLGFSLPVVGDPYDAKLDVAVSHAF
jgi:hypothetical protein